MSRERDRPNQTSTQTEAFLLMVCLLCVCCRNAVAITDAVTEVAIFMASQYTYTEALTECQKTTGAAMIDLRSAQLDWFLNALNNLNNSGSINLGLTGDVYWIGMTYNRAADQWTYSSDSALVSAATLTQYPVHEFCQITGENGALYFDTSSSSWKEICVGSADTKHTACVIPRSVQCTFVASNSREFYPPDSGSMTVTVHAEDTKLACEARCRTASVPEQCWYYSYNSVSNECRVYYSALPLWDASCYMTENTEWNSFVKTCTIFTFDNGLSVTPDCSSVPLADPALLPPSLAAITPSSSVNVAASLASVDLSQSAAASVTPSSLIGVAAPDTSVDASLSVVISPSISAVLLPSQSALTQANQLIQALTQAAASGKQMEGIHGFLPLTLSLLIYVVALILGITIRLFCCMATDNQPKQLFTQVIPMENRKAMLYDPDADNYDTLQKDNESPREDNNIDDKDDSKRNNEEDENDNNHTSDGDHDNDRNTSNRRASRRGSQIEPPPYEEDNSSYYNNRVYDDNPNDPNRVNDYSENDPNGPENNDPFNGYQADNNMSNHSNNLSNQSNNDDYGGNQSNANSYRTENATGNEHGNQFHNRSSNGSYLRPYEIGQIKNTPGQGHRMWRY